MISFSKNISKCKVSYFSGVTVTKETGLIYWLLSYKMGRLCLNSKSFRFVYVQPNFFCKSCFVCFKTLDPSSEGLYISVFYTLFSNESGYGT